MGDIKKYTFIEGCWDEGKVRIFLLLRGDGKCYFCLFNLTKRLNIKTGFWRIDLVNCSKSNCVKLFHPTAFWFPLRSFPVWPSDAESTAAQTDTVKIAEQNCLWSSTPSYGKSIYLRLLLIKRLFSAFTLLFCFWFVCFSPLSWGINCYFHLGGSTNHAVISTEPGLKC